MLGVPDGKAATIKFAGEVIEACRVSAATRAAYCRMIHTITDTGRADGGRSLINMMYDHTDRKASHLFSPTDLRFTIDFENAYPKNVLERAKVVGRILSRDWERNNTDVAFGNGVFEGTKYGACLLKQWVQNEGPDDVPVYYKRLVMPWQFGVYREDENDLNRQSAFCETTMLTLPEVWRRIHHLPNGEDLFKRIKSHASKGQAADENNSFFHQVLSTSQINVNATTSSPTRPGGIVAVNSDPGYSLMGPEVAVDLVRFHEIWVQDEKDYTTIQLIEPDILIAPLYKKCNLLIPGATGSNLHPYTLIQPNVKHGYFWGRPEIVDLIAPQGLLASWADDIRRLFGLQVDKILGFIGFDGMTDETYDQQRLAGYLNGPPGSDIKDLTPKFPPEAIPMLKLIMEIINITGGFPEIMQGRGEQGVRAGVHANTLLKTASPRLRDQSLLIERQCAAAADLRLSLMEAKDGRNYWTKADTLEDVEKSKFLLTDIPEDRRVAVDSHSSSPIFADDHAQLISLGLKAGFVDGHYAIDALPYPDKELLHAKLTEKEQKNAALMAQLAKDHPEVMAKVLAGGRKR